MATVNLAVIQSQMGINALEERSDTNKEVATKIKENKEKRETLRETIDAKETAVERTEDALEHEANRGKGYFILKWFSRKRASRPKRLAEQAQRIQVDLEKAESQLEQVRSADNAEFDQALSIDQKAESTVRFVEDLQDGLRGSSTGLA